MDLYGKFEYSEVADVICRPDHPIILVGSNPMVNNVIRIRTFRIPDESLRLTTSEGKFLPEQLSRIVTNETELRPQASLATGIYLLSGNRDTPNQITVKVLVLLKSCVELDWFVFTDCN